MWQCLHVFTDLFFYINKELQKKMLIFICSLKLKYQKCTYIKHIEFYQVQSNLFPRKNLLLLRKYKREFTDRQQPQIKKNKKTPQRYYELRHSQMDFIIFRANIAMEAAPRVQPLCLSCKS